MGAVETQHRGRGSALLIEHVAALDEPVRPSALERLERIVGGPFARFLVGALRPRRAQAD